MLHEKSKQLNFYSPLYNRIPENHILKLIDSAISFEFVNKTLEASYCKDFGRPAKEPEMMLRILMLQHLYDLSDDRIIGEINVNLAFMWFIGINPDETLPHPSLLTKFRTMRLKDVMMDDIIVEIVRQCVVSGIIPADNGISVDTTHILANTTRAVPERMMKQLAKKIFKAMGKTDYEIPDYKSITDHNEAKQIMKEYLEDVIKNANDAARNEVEEAKEILSSSKFIEQKGIRSLVDKDARVGHKSKTEKFFGYKMEYTLATEGLLITAVTVHDGAYVDGDEFDKLYRLCTDAGLNITETFGDKAYFKKRILDIIRAGNGTAYIPVSACAYRIDEDLFRYNKDSDQWICKHGNMSISKKIITTNRKTVGTKQFYEYTFDKKECMVCPFRVECIKKAKTKGKRLQIGLNSGEYYEHSLWAKTEEFSKQYKKRAGIERKNGEIKRFHGLNKAKGYGLASVTLQAKLVAAAVNLKRIAKLVSSSSRYEVNKLRMPKSVSYSHHNMLIILLKLRINAPRIIEYKVKVS